VRTSRRYGHKLHKEEIYLEDKDMEMHINLYGYCSTALVDLGRYFSFLIRTQSVGLLRRGSVRRKAATYTQNNTNTK
jgi:hypothetical protein